MGPPLDAAIGLLGLRPDCANRTRIACYESRPTFEPARSKDLLDVLFAFLGEEPNGMAAQSDPNRHMSRHVALEGNIRLYLSKV